MDNPWNELRKILTEEFLEVDTDKNITEKTKLGEIPNWDSMAAVNLQLIINETFQVDIPLDLFEDNASFEDLIDFILHPEKIPAAIKRLTEGNL
jgi:acyl carrier protein